MFLPTQPYKGTRDFYPADQRIQSWMFEKLRSVLRSYGFEEYDGPMLEPFELYAAKSGTELVNQQLYSLTDRGERKLAIRPEMTPTLARMVAAKLQELPRPVRWFSIPNLWRYERPQRGRLREHWQLNVDILGGEARLGDVEILTIAADLLRAFGGADKFQIRLNHRGLINYFFTEELKLPPAAALALVKLVDARDKMTPEAFTTARTSAGISDTVAQTLDRFLKSSADEVLAAHNWTGRENLRQLLALLKDAGLESQVIFDPTIMRGLDYYTGTVFEGFDVSGENRRAMFGGGRYDNLVGLFGKQQLSGIGFGMGDVILRDFLQTHALLPTFGAFSDVFLVTPTAESLPWAQALAKKLRLAGLRVISGLSLDGLGAQLKMAARQNVRFAVILGADEYARGEVAVKDLKLGQQSSVKPEALIDLIRNSADLG